VRDRSSEQSDQNLPMDVHEGYDIAFEVPQPTPLILMLSLHPSRTKDLLRKPTVLTLPFRSDATFSGCVWEYLHTRIVASTGGMEISGTLDISDSGRLDEISSTARQHPVDELPDESSLLVGQQILRHAEAVGLRLATVCAVTRKLGKSAGHLRLCSYAR
jgi:hypothetical protein